MAAEEIGLAVAAGIYLFIELRKLLLHDWRSFLALRLVVALTMLIAAAAGWILVLNDHPWIGLGSYLVALTIGQIGGKAIETALQSASGPSISRPAPVEVAFLVLAALIAFVCAVAALVD